MNPTRMGKKHTIPCQPRCQLLAQPAPPNAVLRPGVENNNADTFHPEHETIGSLLHHTQVNWVCGGLREVEHRWLSPVAQKRESSSCEAIVIEAELRELILGTNMVGIDFKQAVHTLTVRVLGQDLQSFAMTSRVGSCWGDGAQMSRRIVTRLWSAQGASVMRNALKMLWREV